MNHVTEANDTSFESPNLQQILRNTYAFSIKILFTTGVTLNKTSREQENPIGSTV